MNIMQNSGENQKLPQLIKQSSTYKMFVPRKVEEKIRYLLRKYPHTEWSGVLFTKHSGNFEDGSLEIYCEDIYPMDLGTSGWTEFKMSEDVAAYMAENLELFDCDCQLIHSHHNLGAFFSGQDLKTLQVEGNDTNCFVSLIVDTRGTYQAAVTRKVVEVKEVTTVNKGSSYEFFGEGPVCCNDSSSPSVKTEVNTVIEYFMLDVQVEHVENPLDYLDTRFDEIEARKKESEKSSIFLSNINNNSRKDNDYSFDDWYKKKKEEDVYASPWNNEPTLWSKEEMKELEVTKAEDAANWYPDPHVIYCLVVQMVLCSLIVDPEKVDLKQWIVRHMENKYKKMFGEPDGPLFQDWSEFIVEFLINQYSDPEEVPSELYEDWDLYQSKIAGAIYAELGSYPDNEYLEVYKKILMRY